MYLLLYSLKFLFTFFYICLLKEGRNRFKYRTAKQVIISLPFFGGLKSSKNSCMNTKQQASLIRTARKIHRFLAAGLFIIFLIIAVTGMLLGWMIFAVVLGMIGAGKSLSLGVVIGLTVLFTGLILTVGRYAVHKVLPWLQA